MKLGDIVQKDRAGGKIENKLFVGDRDNYKEKKSAAVDILETDRKAEFGNCRNKELAVALADYQANFGKVLKPLLY